MPEPAALPTKRSAALFLGISLRRPVAIVQKSGNSGRQVYAFSFHDADYSTPLPVE